jgi:DNA-binding ferritin-like protein (Dps family)
MENLNAEQVKKDLQKIVDNYSGGWTRFNILSNALALINKQETEYNELYELLQAYKADSEAYRSYSKTLEKENEGLKTLLDESFDTQNSLTEENERLKAMPHMLDEEYTETAKRFYKKGVTDMKERIEALFPSDKKYTTISIFTLVQSAKELKGE